jgi:hypothetical protein
MSALLMSVNQCPNDVHGHGHGRLDAWSALRNADTIFADGYDG